MPLRNTRRSVPPSLIGQTPRELTYGTTVRPAMTVSRTIRNKAQTMKGRIDGVSGRLKQTVEKTRSALGRDGGGTTR
jgi:hypothetical protein